MGQDLLLKSDAVVNPTAVTGKSQDVSSIADKGDTESQPFSSTLNEQISKQEISQKDIKEVITSKNLTNATVEKESEVDIDSGNIMPMDAEGVLNLKDTNNKNIHDTKVNINIELDDNVLTENIEIPPVATVLSSTSEALSDEHIIPIATVLSNKRVEIIDIDSEPEPEPEPITSSLIAGAMSELEVLNDEYITPVTATLNNKSVGIVDIDSDIELKPQTQSQALTTVTLESGKRSNEYSIPVKTELNNTVVKVVGIDSEADLKLKPLAPTTTLLKSDAIRDKPIAPITTVLNNKVVEIDGVDSDVDVKTMKEIVTKESIFPLKETVDLSLKTTVQATKSKGGKVTLQAQELKLNQKTQTEHLPETKLISEKEVKAQVITSNQEVKVLVELKHAAPVLRSDILNALNKEKEVGTKSGETVVTKTEKTLISQMINNDNKPQVEMRKVADKIYNKQFPPIQLTKQAHRHESSLFNPTATTTTVNASSAIQVTPSAQPILALQPSLQSEAWGKVLSSRVVWMAREGVQQAELRLNPANLGPVEVKLHMSHDQANISFVAHNAATREALESALPKLRESFQENGMDLSHADVSEHGAEQQDEEKEAASSELNEQQSEADKLKQQDNNEIVDSGELQSGVSVFA